MDTKYKPQQRYTAENCRVYNLKVNRKTETELYTLLEQLQPGTRQTYIKALLRADIDGKKIFLDFCEKPIDNRDIPMVE